MAISTTLFAVGAGLSALSGAVGKAGQLADVYNAPDSQRSQGNALSAYLLNTITPWHNWYMCDDIEHVAETYEKTGYRVDETIHNYEQSMTDFLGERFNRYYFLPIQLASHFECGLTCPKEVLEDIGMRFNNGIRFHNPDRGLSLGKDLRYDNVEI